MDQACPIPFLCNEKCMSQRCELSTTIIANQRFKSGIELGKLFPQPGYSFLSWTAAVLLLNTLFHLDDQCDPLMNLYCNPIGCQWLWWWSDESVSWQYRRIEALYSSALFLGIAGRHFVLTLPFASNFRVAANFWLFLYSQQIFKPLDCTFLQNYPCLLAWSHGRRWINTVSKWMIYTSTVVRESIYARSQCTRYHSWAADTLKASKQVFLPKLCITDNRQTCFKISSVGPHQSPKPSPMLYGIGKSLSSA